jgi:hypothetical protein
LRVLKELEFVKVEDKAVFELVSQLDDLLLLLGVIINIILEYPLYLGHFIPELAYSVL